MLKCTSCGADLREDAKFCVKCGAKAEVKTATESPVTEEEKLDSYFNHQEEQESPSNEVVTTSIEQSDEKSPSFFRKFRLWIIAGSSALAVIALLIVLSTQFIFGQEKTWFVTVNHNEQAGFINAAGEEQIAHQYEVPFLLHFYYWDRYWDIDEIRAFYFTEDYHVVRISDKFGYINRDGRYAINPQFDTATSFVDGLALVSKDGMYGFIDEDGNTVINFEFDYAEPFSDGLALVGIQSNYGFIDKNGEMVINPRYDDAYSFSEGLARVEVNGEYGYIDKNGEMVISPQFDFAMDFSDERARVYIGDNLGFIDKNGQMVINPQFQFALPFSEGLAPVAKDDKIGYIDVDGVYVIDPQFDFAGPFHEGLAAVSIGGKVGFINKEGRIVINPQYDQALPFYNGVALVVTDNHDTRTFKYINEDNEEIYSFNLDY
ncbi:WG repeat-containing protein [Evansella cellulosilytica]|uniref:Zinc-ribbon domain-containing protein n=1 Tax=Evansella cellulosilytica (strain ATCC 21833 / DSM 2522 / FERM P-1141 / JCM 9156 / N-4) TaxID=649639 RepID=E6TT60_EVAC2|nr:WG repeat-containing protein [Evansella cellulosilytica]ADU31968.1 hypothetical protein Bcell_3728 [Evansella cellulosilytica DSM 2522]